MLLVISKRRTCAAARACGVLNYVATSFKVTSCIPTFPQFISEFFSTHEGPHAEVQDFELAQKKMTSWLNIFKSMVARDEEEIYDPDRKFFLFLVRVIEWKQGGEQVSGLSVVETAFNDAKSNSEKWIPACISFGRIFMVNYGYPALKCASVYLDRNEIDLASHHYMKAAEYSFMNTSDALLLDLGGKVIANGGDSTATATGNGCAQAGGVQTIPEDDPMPLADQTYQGQNGAASPTPYERYQRRRARVQTEKAQKAAKVLKRQSSEVKEMYEATGMNITREEFNELAGADVVGGDEERSVDSGDESELEEIINRDLDAEEIVEMQGSELNMLDELEAKLHEGVEKESKDGEGGN